MSSLLAALPWTVRLIVRLARLRLDRADLYVGGRRDPYLVRWHLLPKDKYPVNLYLHHVMRDDDDRALHDHPWWFLSIILWGGYVEVRPREPWKWRCVLQEAPHFDRLWPSLVRDTEEVDVRPGNIIFRRALDAHRLMLRRPAHLGRRAWCWSLVMTGRPRREWGFYCPSGWKPAKEFVRITDDESVAEAGCG